MRHNAIPRFLMVMSLLVLFGCNRSSSTPESATSPEGNSATSAGQDQKVSEGLFAPKPIVIDAGSRITVTIDQTISSKTSNPGDNFDASLAAPVMVGGKQVIPSGAKVSGTVTDSKSAGRFKGNAALSVTLDSITVNGRAYAMKTTSFTETSKGRGKRTAVGAGGGAAVGAIIGAIAGGGKGAAIGAGAGAGAGTAGAAFTGNRDVTISAETNLNFKLTEPLEIRGK